jgi:uncharacterized protein YndB with AHSA1/START domain
MTTADISASVRETVIVQTSAERAFAIFTENISAWWPAEHHIGDEPFARVVIEPQAGGRFYECDVEGTECMWGSVLAFEPPQRLVLGWHLQPDWTYDADPARASEVEVRFIAEGPQSTRVELTHSHFERHGDGGEEIRVSVGKPGGWRAIVQRFAAAVSG